MKIRSLLTMGVAATSVLVSACSTPVLDKAAKKNLEVANRTDELLASAEKPLPSKQWPVTVKEGVWLGGKAKSLRHGKPLPKSVEDGSVTLFSATGMSVNSIGKLITRETGIPVVIAPEVHLDGGATYSPHAKLDHQGKLSTFLNEFTSAQNINWKYDGEKIDIYRNETRTYVMKLLPSTSSGSASISSNSTTSGDDASATSGIDTSSEYSTDLWTEIVEAITSIVGSSGSVTSSKSLGTVSISAPNPTLDRVERYIDGQNKRLSKQVAVNVQVFNVSLSDTSEFATDLNAAIANSDVSIGFDVQKAAGVSNNTNIAWSLLNPISEISNLSGVVKFLNTKGDVSVVTSATATTLNNVPTPIQVGKRRGYVSEITRETDDTGNVTETYSTSEISTGFNMQLLPRVIGGREVALQYSISTAELVGTDDGFDTYVGSSGSVQLPNVNTRAFTQQVMIPSGSTLVLSGFEQTKSRSDKEGVGSADNWLLGGKNSGALERDVMVIMITPTVLEDGNAIVRAD